MTAEHFKLANGTSVSFMDKSGNPVIRKVVNSANIPGTDINIGLLDSDVDSSITYYQLVSSSALQGMLQKTVAEVIDVPIVLFNQSGQAVIHSLSTISNEIEHRLYVAGPRAAFSRDLTGGDSGQPAFLIINGKPILLFTNHSMNAGPNLGFYIAQINQAIDSLGDSGGYHVSRYNTSCFDQSTLLSPSTMTSAPGNFKSCFTGSAKDQVKLSWTPPSDTPDRYALSVDNTAYMSVPSSAREYVHASVAPGSGHSYTLFALRAGYNSSQAQRTDLSNAQICASVEIQPTPAMAEPTPSGNSIPAMTPTPPVKEAPTPTASPVIHNPPPASGATNSQNTNSSQTSPTPTATAAAKSASQTNTATQTQNNNAGSGGNGGSYSSGQSVSGSSYSSGSIITYRQVQNASSGSSVNKQSNTQTTIVKQTSFVSQISRNLKLNDVGNDVRSLQVILNNLGYTVAESGPGSVGQETTTFNDATKKALERYQADRVNVGLKITGVLDNVTLILINSDIANKLSEAKAAQAVIANNISNANSQNNSVYEFVVDIIRRIINGMGMTISNILLILRL